MADKFEILAKRSRKMFSLDEYSCDYILIINKKIRYIERFLKTYVSDSKMFAQIITIGERKICINASEGNITLTIDCSISVQAD